jgi:hypothetical protein
MPNFTKITTIDGAVAGLNPAHVVYFTTDTDTRTAKLVLLNGHELRLSQESTLQWLAEYGAGRE